MVPDGSVSVIGYRLGRAFRHRGADQGSLVGNRRAQKEFVVGNADREGAFDAFCHEDRVERRCAEAEDIIRQVDGARIDAIPAQEFGPHRGDRRLQGSRLGQGAVVRCICRLAILFQHRHKRAVRFLARTARRHGVDENDFRGDRGARQPVPAMRQDGGAESNAIRSRGRGLHHRNDAQRVLHIDRDRTHLFDTRDAVDDMLDAVQLDAYARHLHLAVVSSGELHLASLIHPADVAGAHKSTGHLAGQFNKPLGAHLAVDIAERRRGARDQKLARRLVRQWSEGVRTRDHDPVAWQCPTQRNRAVLRGRDATHGGQDRGFSRPIAIDHGQFGSRLSEPPGKAARECLTDQHQCVKARKTGSILAQSSRRDGRRQAHDARAKPVRLGKG